MSDEVKVRSESPFRIPRSIASYASWLFHTKDGDVVLNQDLPQVFAPSGSIMTFLKAAARVKLPDNISSASVLPVPVGPLLTNLARPDSSRLAQMPMKVLYFHDLLWLYWTCLNRPEKRQKGTRANYNWTVIDRPGELLVGFKVTDRTGASNLLYDVEPIPLDELADKLSIPDDLANLSSI